MADARAPSLPRHRGAVALPSALLAATALVLAALLVPSGAGAAPARRDHTLRFRPVLAELGPADATTVTTNADTPTITQAVTSCSTAQVDALIAAPTPIPSTATEQDLPGVCVVLPTPVQTQDRLYLGKATLTGRAIAHAEPFRQGRDHGVELQLTSKGAKALNALAKRSYTLLSPRNQVAVVVDHVIQAYPEFQTDEIPGGSVQITGFTGRQAISLAAAINRARHGD